MEQTGKASRLKDKDALDVLRLLRAVPVGVFDSGLRVLREDPLASEVTGEALGHLRELFGTTSTVGTVMTIRATTPLEDPATIRRMASDS